MVATSHDMKFVCPALYYPLFAAMSMTTDARVNNERFAQPVKKRSQAANE